MTDLATRVLPHIVVLGRQGSGKGEQSARIARRWGLDHVSTGELLRAAVRAGTQLGRRVEDHLVRGEPVPDDVVAGIVAARLAEADAEGRGVVLDGYPRTVAQADRLLSLLAPGSIDLAIDLEVPRHVVVERMQNRRVCAACGTTGRAATCERCGGPTSRRPDDEPAAIGRRLHDHAIESGPLLAWLANRGVLVTVDGVGTPDEVAARVSAVVEERLLAPAR